MCLFFYLRGAHKENTQPTEPNQKTDMGVCSANPPVRIPGRPTSEEVTVKGFDWMVVLHLAFHEQVVEGEGKSEQS